MGDPSEMVSTPGFQLKLNGSYMDDAFVQSISRVSVHYELNCPAMFSFDYEAFDVNECAWQGINLKTFKPGDKVSVMMGIDEMVPMMEGQITAIEPVFDETYAHVVIRGFDPLYKMRFGTRLHAYLNTTDAGVVRYLAQKSGLQASVSAPSTNYPYLLQNNQSDYSFLMERAGRIGYEVLMLDGKLCFRESQEGKSPVKTLMYGAELTRFNASLDALTKGSSVEVRGWDQLRNQAISSECGNGSEISRMGGKQTGFSVSSQIADSPVSLAGADIVTPADAKSVAKGVYNSELIQFVSGSARCSGMPALRPGVNVELKGMGDTFSGVYYIVAARHVFDIGGYVTDFQVRRTAV